VGVGFGVAVGIGGMVGSGILRTPGEVAAQLRSSWLVIAVWALGGVYALFSILSVTELATMLPREGGWYVYSRQAFGEYVGFVVGSGDWMMQAVPIAYLALAFGEFAAGLEPGLGPHINLVAVASVVILTLLNWLGLRTGSRAQELTSLVKALALIAFVVACFAVPTRTGGTHSSAIASFPASRGNILPALVVALQAVIVTYDGWYSAIYFMEEDQDPARNLPRSAIGGALLCIAIFPASQPRPAARPANGSTGSFPSASRRRRDGGRWQKWQTDHSGYFSGHGGEHDQRLSPGFVTDSFCPKSRDGLLPRWMASVNSGGTPSGALLVGALISVALVVSGSFETLIAIASVLYVAVYMSGFVALFVLGRRQPELRRPFKVWGYPWTTFGVLLASAGFLIASVISDLKHSLFTVGLITISYPVYFFAVKKRTWRP
jgi:basic amino acid/polyamine antiporter, APA family